MRFNRVHSDNHLPLKGANYISENMNGRKYYILMGQSYKSDQKNTEIV